MHQTAHKSKFLLCPEFRTRDRKASRALLDTGRAEVMFDMIHLPDLGREARFRNFIIAAKSASRGDPAVLDLLISSFAHWHDIDGASEQDVRRFWRAGTMSYAAAVKLLRRTCTMQRDPMPPTMVAAIFDDPTFDFVAYLAWHNSDS